jgi:C1A family cysteine protease
MKSLLVLTVAGLAVGRDLSEVATAFTDFKQAYNREYSSAAEEARAISCFAKTLDNVDRLNSADATATYGINHFSDVCAEDFKTMYHNGVVGNLSSIPQAPAYSAAELKRYQAGSFDWRQHGVVTGVKNQGQCGSCWTFSAVAAMEGAWKLAGHSLTSLSEEELVQCAKTAGNGCQGGEMSAAIQWVVRHGGINSEGGYPYTSGRGTTGFCNTAKAATKVAKFTSVLRAPSTESQLEAFLQQHGPLSIAVDAMDGWQSYRGGIKSQCSGRQLDHGVTLIGFGSGFWIVKNSWGTSWGEQGYIRLKMGVNCDGLAEQACAAKA